MNPGYRNETAYRLPAVWFCAGIRRKRQRTTHLVCRVEASETGRLPFTSSAARRTSNPSIYRSDVRSIIHHQPQKLTVRENGVSPSCHRRLRSRFSLTQACRDKGSIQGWSCAPFSAVASGESFPSSIGLYGFGGRRSYVRPEVACRAIRSANMASISYPNRAACASRMARSSAMIGSVREVSIGRLGQFIGGANYDRDIPCLSAYALNPCSLHRIRDVSEVPGCQIINSVRNGDSDMRRIIGCFPGHHALIQQSPSELLRLTRDGEQPDHLKHHQTCASSLRITGSSFCNNEF